MTKIIKIASLFCVVLALSSCAGNFTQSPDKWGISEYLDLGIRLVIATAIMAYVFKYVLKIDRFLALAEERNQLLRDAEKAFSKKEKPDDSTSSDEDK